MTEEINLENIHLKKDEKILWIYREKFVNILNKYDVHQIHDITQLPNNIFTIDPETEKISFQYHHVLTNKRYFCIGLNFEEIRRKEADFLNDGFHLDNFILSIDLKSEYDFIIDYKYKSTIVLVNFCLKIKFLNDQDYNEFKKILIENKIYKEKRWNRNEKDELKSFISFNKLYLVLYLAPILLSFFIFFLCFSQ